ncbi:MAG: hypothetical protein RR816_13705, partial [Clostridia bacterium]
MRIPPRVPTPAPARCFTGALARPDCGGGWLRWVLIVALIAATIVTPIIAPIATLIVALISALISAPIA